MSLLERRLQLLLSQEQYRRVELEAEAMGTSVAAVIREGIDMRLARGSDGRREAAARILDDTASPSEPESPGEDWADIKDLPLSERVEGLP